MVVKEKAFTLAEVVVGMFLAAVLTLGVGIMLSHGQRNWNNLYGRVYGAPATDGLVVHRVFDSLCRKASLRKCIINEGADLLEVYYWDEESTAETPENYGRIYLEDSNVYAERGKLTAGTWQVDAQTESTQMLIATGVDDLIFEVQDKAIRMYLFYQNGAVPPVMSSAVRHNK